MANTLTKAGITTGNTVEAFHVTQLIDAFSGTEAYDISLSGSFNMTGSINGEPGVINPLTASYAMNGEGTYNGTFSGSFSGSFEGDGSGLTGVTATATNFANTDLTFTGNRNHNTDGNDFFLSADGNFTTTTTTDGFLQIGALSELTIGFSQSAQTQYNPGGGFDIKHVGDTVLSGSLTLKGTAVPSTGETLQSWYVSDSTALVSLINATTTDNTFVPTIKSTQPSADNFTPFSWINEIGADTGTFPGLIFQVRSGSNQTVQNRDLFAFRNYTTDIVNIGTGLVDINNDTTITGSLTVSGSAHTIDGDTTFDKAALLTFGANLNVSGSSVALTGSNSGNIANTRVDGGPNGVTLLDGNPGQVLYITCTQVISPGSTVISPSNAAGFTSITFTAVGDTATLLFNSSNWYAISSFGATIS